MRPYRNAAVLLLLALAGVLPARADDGPGATPRPVSPATRAAQVLEAWRGEAGEDLTRLTELEAPDPWLVVDELCFQGEHDAASAYAKAGRRGAFRSLSKYVVACRALEPKGEASRRLVARWERDVLQPVLEGRFVPPVRGKLALASLQGIEADLSEVARLRRARVIGMAMFIAGRRPESEVILVEAAEAAEKLGWMSLAGRLWTMAARVPLATADYDTAIKRLQSSVARCVAAGDEGCEAEALGDLASIRAARGRPEDAMPLLRRAVEAKRRLGQHADLVASLIQLGNVLHTLGDFGSALTCFDEARELAEELENPIWIGVSLANMANVYGDAGHCERAKEIYDAVLDRFKVAREREAEAYAVGSLGNTCMALGDFEDAAECFQAALELCAQFCDPVFITHTHLGIGNLHLKMDEPTTARAHFEEALKSARDMGDKVLVASVMHELGRAYEAEGKPAVALGFHDAALKMAERQGAPIVQVISLCGLARCELTMGRVLEALESVQEAIVRSRGLFRGLSEDETACARGRLVQAFEVGVRAGVEAEDAKTVALFLESSRATALLATLHARDAIRRAKIPALLRDEEAEAQRAVSRAWAGLRRTETQGLIVELRKRRAELEAAEDRLVGALQRIQRHVKRAADVLYPLADELDVIRKRLAPDQALVLFALPEDEALALVIEPGGERIVRLGPPDVVRDACRSLILPEAPWIDESRVEALQLLVTDKLWLSPTTKRVLLSPVGVLAYVPFSLLLPDYEVVYVPSGTTYGVLLADAGKRGSEVLAVGDPDYGTSLHPHARDLYRDAKRGVLHPLPGTREEAVGVGDVVLLGKEATEARLRLLIDTRERWRAIHLACHGLVNPDRPSLSSLALTPTLEDDGFLTALEVFLMEVRADLVVLSACETARGRNYEAEGIVGLTRSFMFAGVPRVICSLWKVDDEATRALMEEFYRLWNPREEGAKGISAAAALRKAQEFVRGHEQWKHPTYWAAWVLWGVPD